MNIKQPVVIEKVIEKASDDADIMDLKPGQIEENDDAVDALFEELDAIFGTPKEELSEEEQKKLEELNSKIEAILAPSEEGEEPELTEEQEEELEELFAQVDAIFGLKSYDDLTEEQQGRVDEIYAELDKHWDDEGDFDGEGDFEDEGEFDNEAAEALFAQLDEIFGTPKEELTEEEQEQVDELNSKIEAILEPNEDGEEPELTEEQEEELEELFAKVDAIYGITSYDDLTEEQQAKVDESHPGT